MMSSFRFLHAADIHLDSPLRGLARHDGLPVARIRDATRRALDNLVELAIAEKVAFVILAGDLYDGTWKDAGTGLYMARKLGRLLEHGITTYILQGNHDSASSITRDLPLPPGVERFPSGAPETFRIDALRVALHGQSFGQRCENRDMTPRYPAPVPGYFNIGVLHTSLSGHGEHETYAPCTPEALRAKGYDYWALGHVHERAVLGEAPHIVFPGVLQGRHIRETGVKGVTLVEVVDGKVHDLRHVACDVVRWARVVVDCTGVEDEAALDGAIRAALEAATQDVDGDRLLVARVELRGETPLHARLSGQLAALRERVQQLAAMAPGAPEIEKVSPLTRAPRSVEDEAAGGDELALLVREALHDPELVEQIAAELAPLLRELPTLEGGEASEVLLAHARRQDFAALLEPVSEMLEARLRMDGDAD